MIRGRTHTTVLRLCGFCLGQPGWAGTRRNITHSHSLWSSIIPICFLHLLRSMASSLFNPSALQSFSTISKFSLVYLLAWHPLLHTQSLSSFRNTCPYHRNLFCCSTEIMSSKLSLPLNSLLATLSCNFSPHIHLTILISAIIFLSYRPGCDFCATYCFAHNCCTISLSLSMIYPYW